MIRVLWFAPILCLVLITSYGMWGDIYQDVVRTMPWNQEDPADMVSVEVVDMAGPQRAQTIQVAQPLRRQQRQLAGALQAPKLWADYKRKFVSSDGRVIDTANGRISHSEGQGYGLLMALAADDQPTFARIWGWTRRNLDIREDALSAWRWNPAATPHVDDMNNASDGDVLIIWALVEAAKWWDKEEYRQVAHEKARDLAELLIRSPKGDLALLPGKHGFTADDRPDGPIVNLSYWVFPAFDALKNVDPESDWIGLRNSGLKLMSTSRFGAGDLPPEWLALGGSSPNIANGFDADFGYNAIRIPLYLAWWGDGERQLLAPFTAAWVDGDPAVVDLKSGRKKDVLRSDGYKAVAALAFCAMNGKRLPAFKDQLNDDHYYPATLKALVLIAANQRYPECK